MLGFASRRRGEGAPCGRDVLGKGAPSKIVRVGLVRQVAWTEETEDQKKSRRLWRVGRWHAYGLAKRGEGCGGRRVGQSVDQVAGSALGVVGGGCLGHGAIVGKITGFGDSFGDRGRYVDSVAAIVLRGCADEPSVDTMPGPGAADGRGFMD